MAAVILFAGQGVMYAQKLYQKDKSAQPDGAFTARFYGFADAPACQKKITSIFTQIFFMRPISEYQGFFLDYLKQQPLHREPANLYAPVQYIMELGGKRLRPVLTLMAAEIFGTSYQKALPAAVAVEVFHNFSLVHDDIMDDAPLRRGQPTVHEKWSVNTAILSGDAMLILAYQYFEQYEPAVFRDLAKLFSKTAIEVCEGQQWDVDFETRADVSVPEYLKMIEYKTAVLLGAALKMGGIIARTSDENCRGIYDFGICLGIAFQLQDDYLDAFGNPETFGKQVGGDIIENKKTHLYLLAMQHADLAQKQALTAFFSDPQADVQAKILQVKQLFEATGAARATREAIAYYTEKAYGVLESLCIPEANKGFLRDLGELLLNRTV